MPVRAAWLRVLQLNEEGNVIIMNMNDFAEALASKDLEKYSAWFADDIKLFTPIHEEPMIGKQVACQMLPIVFSLFDNFRYMDVIIGERTHALVFQAEVDGVPLEGVDYVRTDENRRVTELSVMMRPLKAIATLNKAIAAKMQSQQAGPTQAE